MTTIGLYPGSFDPFHWGHVDVLRQASRLFDTVIVVVADNASKNTWFDADQRVDLIMRTIKNSSLPSNISVFRLSGLIAHNAKDLRATHLIRGVRNISDAESELAMAKINRRIYKTYYKKSDIFELETVLFPASPNKELMSSSLAKDIALNGGDTDWIVPNHVSIVLRDHVDRLSK